MEFCKVLFTLCVISSSLAEQSPVFLWGVNGVPKPSLTTVTQEELIAAVQPTLSSKPLIVFLENALTNKDFLCEIESESCLAHLSDFVPKSYYLSVQDPVQSLQSLPTTRENLTFNEGTFLRDLKQLLKTNKIIFVNFDDHTSAIGNRALLLKQHDSLMTDIHNELKEEASFMYTTSSNDSVKKIRHRRDVAPGGYIFRDGANLLLYFQSLTYIHDKEVTNIAVTGMSVKMNNGTSMSVELTNNSTKQLMFSINLSHGYFYMLNIHYGDTEFRVVDAMAPTSFSYYCGNLTLHTNASTALLKWNGLQFQAPFGTIKDNNFKFGDPWHCVGFVSGAILMGLLIVALLLSILFTGLCWIKDINTMDRFDDPKGKTITISATE